MTALLGLATRLELARLLLITDGRGSADQLAEFADAAFAGGVDILQLRDPGADDAELLAGLSRLRAAAHRYQGLVSVFESVRLAETGAADLLHLPERGLPAGQARGHLHQWALIGRSCHTPAQVEAAVADAEVNYFTVGPVFAVDPAEDLDLVRYAARLAPPGELSAKPWFAVGGITADNLDRVLGAGARRVAVSRAITAATDPEAAALALKDRLRQAWSADPAMQSLTLKVFQS